MTPHNGDESRLDRIERMLELHVESNQRAHEEFEQRLQRSNEGFDRRLDRQREEFDREHKVLLTAQVLLVGHMRELDVKMAETTDKLNGLIAVIDDFIRRNGKEKRK